MDPLSLLSTAFLPHISGHRTQVETSSTKSEKARSLIVISCIREIRPQKTLSFSPGFSPVKERHGKVIGTVLTVYFIKLLEL